MEKEFGFPRREHLRKRLDFRNVYDNGHKFVDKAFVLLSVKNGFEYNRFGISVSKKVGNAVTRNRIKRYFREYYRLSRPKQVKGLDLLVIARWRMKEIDFTDGNERFLRAIESLHP